MIEVAPAVYVTRAGTHARVSPDGAGFAWRVDGFRGASGWEPDATRAWYAVQVAADIQCEAQS